MTERFHPDSHEESEVLGWEDRLKAFCNFEAPLPQLSRAPAVDLQLEAGIGRTDQTQDLTAIASLLKSDRYVPPMEGAPSGALQVGEQTYRVIGRETRIDGGVDLSYGLNYGICIDFQNDPVLRSVAKSFAGGLQPDMTEDDVLESLMEFTSKVLPYDEGKVMEYRAQLREGEAGAMEYQQLGQYIYMGQENGHIKGAGICQQEALFSAAMTERMIDAGILDGKTAVLRNHVYADGSVHRWQIYEPRDGGLTVIDPGQGIKKPAVHVDAHDWDYGLRAA